VLLGGTLNVGFKDVLVWSFVVDKVPKLDRWVLNGYFYQLAHFS
jgi:hypothetical protein